MKSKFVPFLLLVVILATVLLLATPSIARAQGPGPVTGIPTFDLSPQKLIDLLAGLLSIVFMYTPKLRTWFAGLETEVKSGAMILMLALLTIVVTVLACNGLLNVTNFECTKIGIIEMVYTYLWAIAINQGTFLISPEPADVKAVKAAKKLAAAAAWQNGVQ